MTDDLVERLRQPMWIGQHDPELKTDPLRMLAADRIETLSADLELAHTVIESQSDELQTESDRIETLEAEVRRLRAVTDSTDPLLHAQLRAALDTFQETTG